MLRERWRTGWRPCFHVTMTRITFPAPGTPRPPFSDATGLRTILDRAGDARGDIEANVRFADDGMLMFASNGRDRHLADQPSTEAQAAVQRYVDAFSRNDAALLKLGDHGSAGDRFGGVPRGEFELLLFRRGDGPAKQVIRGTLDAVPAPVQDLLDAAAALQPHLNSFIG